jgi:hypothetical protein
MKAGAFLRLARRGGWGARLRCIRASASANSIIAAFIGSSPKRSCSGWARSGGFAGGPKSVSWSQRAECIIATILRVVSPPAGARVCLITSIERVTRQRINKLPPLHSATVPKYPHSYPKVALLFELDRHTFEVFLQDVMPSHLAA